MMGSLSLRAIAGALHAEYSGADLEVRGITTDSRRTGYGDLYVALRGERFDGQRFVADVAAQDAVAAVVNTVQPVALPQLQVADTRAALGVIANLNRRRFQGPVIGVTGSAGKTTCKEMLAAILARCGDVLATQGNLNNEIGVPLTLLRLAPEHRYGVIEMGAARSGDIAYLCRFAEPDVGIVTAALPAHLEGFGDVETVAKTKGELFEGLAAGGTAVVSADSPWRDLWMAQAGARRVLTFGLRDGADVGAHAVVNSPQGSRFELVTPAGSIDITLALLGRHNLRNALAAAAAALAVGAPLGAVRDGLAAVRPVAGRLQPRSSLSGKLVIDDSYNANPGAVRAAIDVLAGYAGKRRLILGNMAELGVQAGALHEEVAAYAAERGIDELWCVGPWAQRQVAAFQSASRSGSAAAFADNNAVIDACGAAPEADATLVKGSRSAGMEVVVASLCGAAATEGGH